ncbi:MAG TPA: hypothetical protein PKC43_12330 [Phycisphaerales bacterium]|nr:hypothetical protein [Phycisphaerales bacterium]HMP38220.1 hypothetical protein [Phycisphaerales bacterium]
MKAARRAELLAALESALESESGLDAFLSGIRAPATAALLEQLAATAIFDRGLAELIHALPELAGRHAAEPSLGALGRWLDRPGLRASIGAIADALEQDPAEAIAGRSPVARLWEDARAMATRRTDAVAPLFGDGDIEPMDAPPGWFRVRAAARDRHRGWSRPRDERIALATIFALYAAECAAGDRRDRDGHRNRLLHHLFAIAPEAAVARWRRALDEADGAFDLPRCADLIAALEASSGLGEDEAAGAQSLPSQTKARLLARARARLEARLVTSDAWYRSMRYFERPALHAAIEALLGDRGGGAGRNELAQPPPVMQRARGAQGNRSRSERSRGEEDRAAANVGSDGVGPARWILHLHAPGGAGKTMLLRWLAARRCAPSDIPVATIDFDSYAIRPDLWELLLRVAEAIDRQLPGRPLDRFLRGFGDPLRRLAQPVAAAVDTSRRAGLGARERLQRERETEAGRRERAALDAHVPDALAERLREALARPSAGATGSDARGDAAADAFGRSAPDAPSNVVIVVDTMEQATHAQRTDLPSLIDALRRLHDAVPQLRVLLAGRYDLLARRDVIPGDAEVLAELLEREGSVVRVEPFSDDEARAYLLGRGLGDRRSSGTEGAEVGSEILDAIVEKCRGNPLKLALFADIAQSAPLTPAEIRGRADIDLIYLVERVLSRLDLVELRWIIRYGAIPQRLTREYFSEVLLPTLSEAVAGSVEWDDPEVDLEALPPSMRRRDLFARTGLTIAAADVDRLWGELGRFAAGSSWVMPVAGDPNALEFHSSVLDPMRRLLRSHRVFGLLHRRAAALAERRGEELPDRRAELRAAALKHLVESGSEGAEAAIQRWRRWRDEALGSGDTEARLVLAGALASPPMEGAVPLPTAMLAEVRLDEAEAAAALIAESGPTERLIRSLRDAAGALDALGEMDPAALRTGSMEPAAWTPRLAFVRGEAARLVERDDDALTHYHLALEGTSDAERRAEIIARIDAIERRLAGRDHSRKQEQAEVGADALARSTERLIAAHEAVVEALLLRGEIERRADGRVIAGPDAEALWQGLDRLAPRLHWLGRSGEFVNRLLPQMRFGKLQRDAIAPRLTTRLALALAGLHATAAAALQTSRRVEAPLRASDQRSKLKSAAPADEAILGFAASIASAVDAGDVRSALEHLATLEAVEGAYVERASSRRSANAELLFERGRALSALLSEPEAAAMLESAATAAKSAGSPLLESQATVALAAHELTVHGSIRAAAACVDRALRALPSPASPAPDDDAAGRWIVWVDGLRLDALAQIRQGDGARSLHSLDGPLQLLHLNRGPAQGAARLALVATMAAQAIAEEQVAAEREETRKGRHAVRSGGDSPQESAESPPASRDPGVPSLLSAGGLRGLSAWFGSVEWLFSRMLDELRRIDAPTARAAALDWLAMLGPIEVPEEVGADFAALLPLDGPDRIRLPEGECAPLDRVSYDLVAAEAMRVVGRPHPAAMLLGRAWEGAAEHPLAMARVLESATNLLLDQRSRDRWAGSNAPALGASARRVDSAPELAALPTIGAVEERLEIHLRRLQPLPGTLGLIGRMQIAVGEYAAASGRVGTASQMLDRLAFESGDGDGRRVRAPALERRRLLLEAEIAGDAEPALRVATMAAHDGDELLRRRIERVVAARRSDAVPDELPPSPRRGRSGASRSSTRMASGRQAPPSAAAKEPEARGPGRAASAVARLRSALDLDAPVQIVARIGLRPLAARTVGRTLKTSRAEPPGTPPETDGLAVVASFEGETFASWMSLAERPAWLSPRWREQRSVIDRDVAKRLLGEGESFRAALAAALLPSRFNPALSRRSSRPRIGLRLELDDAVLFPLPWEWALAPRIAPRTLSTGATSETGALALGSYRGIERVAADRESVAWLQSALNLLGEKLMVDGVVGPSTLRAIESMVERREAARGGSASASASDADRTSASRSARGSRRRDERHESPGAPAEPEADPTTDVAKALLDRLRERLGPAKVLIVSAERGRPEAYAAAGLAVEHVRPTHPKELASIVAGMAPQIVLLEGGFSSDVSSGRLELDLHQGSGRRRSSREDAGRDACEPSDLDMLVSVLPRGRRPMLVLDALPAAGPLDAAEQLLARNAFAGETFRLGNAPAIVARGGLAPDGRGERDPVDVALAAALGAGQPLAEAIVSMRRAVIERGAARQSSAAPFEDAAFIEVVLYAHDPRWRPAVGRPKVG